MKNFRMNIDYRGRDKSWTRVVEVAAETEECALIKMYMDLHNNMHCTFRIWSCIELTENPKLEVKNETLDLF